MAAAVTEAEKAEQRALRGGGRTDAGGPAAGAVAFDRLWINGGPVKLPGKIVAALAGRIMAAGSVTLLVLSFAEAACSGCSSQSFARSCPVTLTSLPSGS
jgi:hypothetical protein